MKTCWTITCGWKNLINSKPRFHFLNQSSYSIKNLNCFLSPQRLSNASIKRSEQLFLIHITISNGVSYLPASHACSTPTTVELVLTKQHLYKLDDKSKKLHTIKGHFQRGDGKKKSPPKFSDPLNQCPLQLQSCHFWTSQNQQWSCDA